MAALTALILHYPYDGIDFHGLGMGLLWLALIATVASGVSYFRAFFRQYPESPLP
jgi:CDP-diacylglycerol--glycerol-3-phosphate 3-phosphatidyltransferase